MFELQTHLYENIKNTDWIFDILSHYIFRYNEKLLNDLVYKVMSFLLFFLFFRNT